MIKPLQANERVIYLHDIPEAVELHDFIKEMENKYHVKPFDPDYLFSLKARDQSFGFVDLEMTTLPSRIEDIKLWAFANGNLFDRLPEHSIKPENTCFSSFTGIECLRYHIMPYERLCEVIPFVPLMDAYDRRKLIYLRHQFAGALWRHKIQTPKMNWNSIKHLYGIERLLWKQKQLRKLGFADGSEDMVLHYKTPGVFEDEIISVYYQEYEDHVEDYPRLLIGWG